MLLFNAFIKICKRDIKILFRLKINLIASIVGPVAWLAVLGSLPMSTNSGRYLDYVTPGIMVMSVMMPSLQSGLLTSADKIYGYLKKIFATPTPRPVIVMGKITAAMSKGMIHLSAVLATAWILGARMEGGLAGLLLVFGCALFFAMGLSALSIFIAFKVADLHGFGAIISLVSLPLFLASSALMPLDKMPAWLRCVASINPVTYIIDISRKIMLTGNISGCGLILLILISLALSMIILCMRTFEKGFE